jgi:hypothetical protein
MRAPSSLTGRKYPPCQLCGGLVGWCKYREYAECTQCEEALDVAVAMEAWGYSLARACWRMRLDDALEGVRDWVYLLPWHEAEAFRTDVRLLQAIALEGR